MKRMTALALFLGILTAAAGQETVPALRIERLRENFFVYTTYGRYQGSPVPANGMYVVTTAGVVLFDTPWDSTQFRPLQDSIERRHGQKVVLCLATHFHEDRTAGLAFYRAAGVATYTTRLTDDWSRKRGMKRAQNLINSDTVFRVGQYRFVVYYPGAGHTVDNVVVWFPAQRVLYGGCLVKSAVSTDLGNLADGDTAAYAATIQKVMNRCQHPQYVVAGHNDWQTAGALEHTLQMAKKLKPKPAGASRAAEPSSTEADKR